MTENWKITLWIAVGLVIAVVWLALLLILASPASARGVGHLDPTIRVTTPHPGNTVRVRYRLTCDGVTERGWYRATTPTIRHIDSPVVGPHDCRFKAWAWNLTGPAEPNVHVSL